METDTLSYHDLLFDIGRSVRYHNRRRAFFDRIDRLANMLSVIFGSTAVYGVLAQDHQALALTAAALVTVLSAINLVVGSSQKARAHADFARRFIELEKRMIGVPADSVELSEIWRDRLSIEADEPPVLNILNVICHNEQMRSMGYPGKKMASLRWWQRAFAQIIDLREDLIAVEPSTKPD